MKARFSTHKQPTSLESGFTKRRFATMEKIIRSTASASTRFVEAT